VCFRKKKLPITQKSCLLGLGLVGGVLGSSDGLGDGVLDGGKSLVDLLREVVIERAPGEEEEDEEVGDPSNIESLEDEGKDEAARDEADREEDITDKDDVTDKGNKGLDDASHELEEALEVAVILRDVELGELALDLLTLEVGDDALHVKDKSGEESEEGNEEDNAQEVVLVAEDESSNNVDNDEGDGRVDEVGPVEDVMDLLVSLDVLEGSLEGLDGAVPVKVALATTAALGRSSLGLRCRSGFRLGLRLGFRGLLFLDLLFDLGCDFLFRHVC